MKLWLALCAVVLLFWTSETTALTHHTYVNGTVLGISGDMIKIDDKIFTIAPKAKIVVQDKRNGAYFEERASRSYISVGNSVTVRAMGNLVNEIIIERWKR
ncbi:pilus assembly protein PilL [Geobacter sulfurreducens]|uniref:pilus assembly protein PilL n=1 Tax=Geobacter sulfurreducens TaxID=35554 RepID=UPI000DBB47DA|nr:pilus assembly protein PilL [Geobacter sulfurreducens]BBA70535.1 hypothetical protein YM18_2015 [Geobacter sulfurreducens]